MELFFHVFWLFLILAAISPYLAQQTRHAARARRLNRLEKQRRSRAITLIHRLETLSVLGVPVKRYPHVDDSDEVLRAIRATDRNCPIDIVLHVPSGLSLATEQIAEALANHSARVTVFIPHYAMSGGTLMALAADEIVMDADAVLGPLEPQIGPYPAASILTVPARKEIRDIKDETMILIDVAQRAVKQEQALIVSLLERKGWDASRAEILAANLTQGPWTPNCPIRVDEARALGLSISTEMPQEVYELMSLYAQPRSGKPCVQYVPAG